MLTSLGRERAGTSTWARHGYVSAGPEATGRGTARLEASAVAAGAVGALDERDELTAAIEGARRADSESFRILYRDMQPRLLRYLSYLVAGDAEDVASETWLQATRDLHDFHGDYDSFRGWITTIARHRAMDHLRRASRQPAVPVPVEELAFVAGREDTADRAIESITTDEALSLIAALPPDQAEAVLLRAIVGLDAKSAAQVAGKRAGAIRTAAYRGLKTLANRLDRDLFMPNGRANSLPFPSLRPYGGSLWRRAVSRRQCRSTPRSAGACARTCPG